MTYKINSITSITGTAARVSASTSAGATTLDLISTAVTPGSYTYSSLTVDSYGRITAASSGTAAVTSVSGAATRISSTGGLTPVIDLITTAVTPGSYTYGGFTVDSYGRLTAASSGTSPVTSVTGTAARISSTGGATPVIDIDAAYVGQSSITTLGTIATGTWNATTISATKGGTGVSNASGSTITLGGSLTTSGAFGCTFTLSGTTNVTLPTSGTLTTLSTVISTANTWTAAQRGAFSTLTDAATITPDFSLANNYNVTLGGNRTLGFPTNIVAGQTGVISVRQDITGSRTLAYAWPYIFPNGVTPVLSTGKLVMDQLYYCVNSYSTSTVTVTIATPAVMTWTAHGLVSGLRLQLTTTGALPTGLSANTTYWVTVIDANTFNLSTSLANAQAATFIATSGSQSGTHTAINASITISFNLGLA